MFSNQNRCEYHAAPIKQFRFSSLGLCDIEFSYQNVGVDRRVLRLCRNPGLNQGPLDLQSNALPTELLRQYMLQQRDKPIDTKKVTMIRRKIDILKTNWL